MTVVTVIGARPQFVKAGPLVLAARRLGCDHVLLHTGQHSDWEMSEVFFQEFSIRPDIDLGISGGTHGQQTGRMLESIEQVLLDIRPSHVLVLGDTNSTVAGALAAAKLHVPLGHVEAGLRSYNARMPEEVNRVVTDHVADVLFAPHDSASLNLVREGISRDKIVVVGDVMYDAYRALIGSAATRSGVIQGLSIGEPYLLATVHRAENTDNPERLTVILDALVLLANHLQVVFPLHPRTRKTIGPERLRALSRSLLIVDPVGYLDMLAVERRAAVIVTDSGGVQKEAFFAGVPCVTLRDETEWTELISAGWNRLAPPHSVEDVTHAVLGALGSKGEDVQPYGNGQSADAIMSYVSQ